MEIHKFYFKNIRQDLKMRYNKNKILLFKLIMSSQTYTEKFNYYLSLF